jgi:uncharacterized protein (TIGR02271 family)
MKTVVGLFDSFDDARLVVDELTQAGVARNMVRLENESKGESAFLGADETTHGGAGALRGGLLNLGVPREDADMYTEGVRRGGTLIVVTADDGMATRVYDIMARHGSVDLEERSKVWLKSGWSGLGDTKMKTTQTATSRTTTGTELRGRELKEGEAVLPVIEEEMRVGKREIQKGGIRAYSHVTEVPVEEKINLREEHVHVERRPVDRPVTDADRMAFKDQTIEVRERSEEAVVSKQRRVIEEVVIGKDVGQRTETVRDTVRRTDVEVEQLGGKEVTSGVRWETFDKDFRTHYKGLNLSDTTYDEYLPVYRYGYTLGTDQQYSGRDWTTIEPDARLYWEERNPGTWEKFKDTIRYAWDRVRGHR